MATLGAIMRDLAEDTLWLRDRARELLMRDAAWRRRLQAWLVVGGVCLAGLSEVVSAQVPVEARPYISALWLGGLVAAFVGGLVFAFIDEGAPDAIARAQAAVDEANERGATLQGLVSDFKWMTRIYRVSIALREYVEAVLLDGAGDDQAQKARLGSMLDIVLAEKDVLLGVKDEAWNFSIYLYDRDSDTLRCAVCRRPSRAEEEAQHRDWKPGKGHTGLAWQWARELVVSDSGKPEVEAIFAASEDQRKDGDSDRYRSLAALPIRMQGEDPKGVLVATSDRVNRYRPRGQADSGIDNVEPLRVLSTSLAMVLHAAHLQPRKGLS